MTEEQKKKQQESNKWAADRFGVPVDTVKWYNSGICYDRICVTTKEAADKVTAACEGQTVNGGMFHGMGLGGQTHCKKENYNGEWPYPDADEYWDIMC